jgi:hypothetical protein
MVDVDASHIECPRRRKMIDLRLDAIGVAAPVQIEVLGYELILPRMTVDAACLPSEIVGDQRALELGKGGG